VADVILFPQVRNIGKARHVAALWMQRKPGRERDTYWLSVTKRFRNAAGRLGLVDREIDREIAGLRDAVENQILAIQQRTEDHFFARAADFVEAHRMLDEAMSDVSAEIRGQSRRDVTPRHVTPSPDNPGAA
jgi:hypothetical protein